MKKLILNWKPAATLNSYPERETYRDNARVFSKKTRDLLYSSQPILTLPSIDLTKSQSIKKQQRVTSSSNSLLIIDHVLNQGTLDCLELECMLSDPIIYKSRDLHGQIPLDLAPMQPSTPTVPKSLPDIHLNSPLLLYQPGKARNSLIQPVDLPMELPMESSNFILKKDRSAFYKDHDRLIKIQHDKINNLTSGMFKDLSLCKCSVLEFLSVHETFSILWNTFVYVLDMHQKLFGDRITNDLSQIMVNGGNPLELKMELSKSSRNKFIQIKTIMGHFYRLIQAYGDIALLQGISIAFGSLILNTNSHKSVFLWNEWTPQMLYNLLFHQVSCMTLEDALLYNMILHFHQVFESNPR